MCKLPKDFRFAFSKLQLYEQCPMAFKLIYVDHAVVDDGNAYSDYGTFCHQLLEQWAKGQLLDFMLADAYERGYEQAIKHDFPSFPAGQWDKFRQQGLDYFTSFDGFGDNYEILSVEQKFVTTFAGYPFSGIADLILKDKTTGDIVVIDHKSKSRSSMEKDLDVYRKQLYIYAHNVMETYGKFPKKLIFNGFRENYVYEQEFDPQVYVKSLEWVGETIHKIENDSMWVVSSSPFYCRNLCGAFFACPAAESVLHPPEKTIEWNGVTKTVREWADETGIPKATLTRRLNKGLTAEEIFAPTKSKKKNEEEKI